MSEATPTTVPVVTPAVTTTGSVTPQADVIDGGSLETMFSTAAAAPVTPAATPATPAAPVAPATPVEPNLAEQAAEFGLQLPATATEREVASALVARMREITPFAQYGQSLAPHAAQIQQFFAQATPPQSGASSPTAPAVAAAPEEWTPKGHFSKLWDAPQLTPQMQYAINQGMVVTNPETGMLEAKPGLELMVAPILADLNHAVNWKREQWRGIMDGNPYQHFYEKLDEPIRRAAREEVQRYLGMVQQQTQQTQLQTTAAESVNAFEKENASWLFQAAAGGGQIPTEKGKAFIEMARQHGANWTGDANTLLNLCKAAVLGTLPNTPAASPAATVPNVAAVNAQQQQTFLERAIDRAAHTPTGGANTVNSPAGPVVLTPGELENLFLNEFNAARTAA